MSEPTIEQREWYEEIESLKPLMVQIWTPRGSGSGFLLTSAKLSHGGPLVGIATAAHVIDDAHFWEQPIRVHHHDSNETRLLRPNDRAIRLSENGDSAVVIFEPNNIPFPDAGPTLIDDGKYQKPGCEVGWLGFPGLPDASLSFFSGHVSSYIKARKSYLVDGVAINGVSGGPAFTSGFKVTGGSSVSRPGKVIGVVAAYMPNRSTGETLPGLAVIQGVSEFHDIVAKFKSLGDAQNQQTPPSEKPPTPPPEGATRGS